ncbi:uncharacterized protein LOC126370786 [Pectinophora gossypiella]|uniref:uncharacterized protein LOC126370786 n=1 Tax=Pectinophora gossypiella TaxID=13191 RepID=UPI00214E3ACE|nr:uncharacterized protein LOC126370786 [Pectinophora gossypiella]
MEDLLKIQIYDNCRIALPEGLKDLMSDISREVLRAQPKDLLGFIADYLSTLLVTRENLSIASRLCRDVCKYLCATGLEDELKYLGLSVEDVAIVTKLVNKHLDAADEGKIFEEGNLLQKLLLRTSIPVEQMSKIQEAVRKTFLRHYTHQTGIFNSTPDADLDEVSKAVRHTMDLYRKTHPTEDQYHRMAIRIQAAYRAYGVRRELAKQTNNQWTYADDVLDRADAAELHYDEIDKDIQKATEIVDIPGNST